jgi:acid phosphatase family membrane protein YuiD
MRFLQQIFSNYILLSAIVSWMLAQIIKTLLTLVQTKKFNAERMFGAGGMPSAHSAMVAALTMGISRQCGFSSPEFALSVAFAAVVIYDAMGVRRAAGEQAKVLNKMVDIYEKNWPDTELSTKDKDLKEYLGHTPMEVLAGVLLGFLVYFAWYELF